MSPSWVPCPHCSMLTGGNYKRHHFKSTPNLVTIRLPTRGVNANTSASNTTCLRPPSHKTAASLGSPHVTCPTPRSPQARENTNGNIRRTWSFFVIQHKESVVPGPIPPVLQPNPKTNYPPWPPRLGSSSNVPVGASVLAALGGGMIRTTTPCGPIPCETTPEMLPMRIPRMWYAYTSQGAFV